MNTIKIEPGSLVVVTFDPNVAIENIDAIATHLRAILPEGQPCIFIPEGIKIAALDEKLLRAAGLELISSADDPRAD